MIVNADGITTLLQAQRMANWLAHEYQEDVTVQYKASPSYVLTTVSAKFVPGACPHRPIPSSKESLEAGIVWCCGHEENAVQENAKLRNVIQCVFSLPEVQKRYKQVMGENALPMFDRPYINGIREEMHIFHDSVHGPDGDECTFTKDIDALCDQLLLAQGLMASWQNLTKTTKATFNENGFKNGTAEAWVRLWSLRDSYLNQLRRTGDAVDPPKPEQGD